MGVCRVCSFYFKQKTAYDMRISDWSSDVCSSDLSPVMRSAVAAFGFVYIHPLADGNGRVHRFLINDILRRDGAVPEPVILPVSAVITDDSGERRSYDLVLDEVSKPLMQAAREHIAFTSSHPTYPDCFFLNFN